MHGGSRRCIFMQQWSGTSSGRITRNIWRLRSQRQKLICIVFTETNPRPRRIDTSVLKHGFLPRSSRHNCNSAFLLIGKPANIWLCPPPPRKALLTSTLPGKTRKECTREKKLYLLAITKPVLIYRCRIPRSEGEPSAAVVPEFHLFVSCILTLTMAVFQN